MLLIVQLLLHSFAVVNPSAGNLGGGGFVVYLKNNKIYTIDYREKAPIKSHKDMYLNSEGDVIKGLSLESYLHQEHQGQ